MALPSPGVAVCHWGETDKKRETVARHLAAKGYRPT